MKGNEMGKNSERIYERKNIGGWIVEIVRHGICNRLGAYRTRELAEDAAEQVRLQREWLRR